MAPFRRTRSSNPSPSCCESGRHEGDAEREHDKLGPARGHSAVGAELQRDPDSRGVGEATPSTASGCRSANTISLASVSSPLRPWMAAWSRRNGSSAIARTNGRSVSTASCKAGTPPTRRPSSVISACARLGGSKARTSSSSPSSDDGWNTPRCTRPAEPVRGQCRADRGQGLRHPSDPGANG